MATDGTGIGSRGGRVAIGVDVGGSGIKAAVVDLDTGTFLADRIRVPTPKPADPDHITASINRLVKRLVKASGISDGAPVGVGLPGVAIDGRLATAANIDSAWVGYPIAEDLAARLKRPVTIVNDADAAGIAEMRFGVGAGKRGVVVFLTLGTGVGSGVFHDGVLLPNTEFGQMEIRGRPAEFRSASAARQRKSLSWKAWAIDLDEHIQRIEALIWPNLFILGGGVSKNAEKFIPRLTARTPVVAAALRNDAGIIGAAIVATEGLRDLATRLGDVATTPGDVVDSESADRLGEPAGEPGAETGPERAVETGPGAEPGAETAAEIAADTDPEPAVEAGRG